MFMFNSNKIKKIRSGFPKPCIQYQDISPSETKKFVAKDWKKIHGKNPNSLHQRCSTRGCIEVSHYRGT